MIKSVTSFLSEHMIIYFDKISVNSLIGNITWKYDNSLGNHNLLRDIAFNLETIPLGTHVIVEGSWKKEKFEILKLESFHLSWKVPIEVGKFSMQYYVTKNFPISARTFQLKSFQLPFFPTILSIYKYPKN